MLAFTGFWIGTHGQAQIGAYIVLATVFLMGTHSAFFVPAKYGVMPEIIAPSLLSRGNGILESLSFLAVILGTVSGGVLSFLFLRKEWIIGLILCVFAVIGAMASLVLRRMPAANPQLPFPRFIFKPLYNNIKTMLKRRSLLFAVIGIAFFTFIVAFMRATVYMLGESQNPRWDELRTSVIVGTVALGIGLGSPVAGWLSGHKVELGLIPLGALGMMGGCLSAAFNVHHLPMLIASIVLIGFSTGFYLVPLFTLLQFRAPKISKGDTIATSNLINVTGAIAASALFFVLVLLAHRLHLVKKIEPVTEVGSGELVRLDLERGRPVYFEVKHDGAFFSGGRKWETETQPSSILVLLLGNEAKDREKSVGKIHVHRGIEIGADVTVSCYQIDGVIHYGIDRSDAAGNSVYDSRSLPRFLFVGAGAMTMLTLGLLILRVPDLLARVVHLCRSLVHASIEMDNSDCLPASGPFILKLTTSDRLILGAVRAVIDRAVRFTETDLQDSAPIQKWLQAGIVVGLIQTKRPQQDLVPNSGSIPIIEVVVEQSRNRNRIRFYPLS